MFPTGPLTRGRNTTNTAESHNKTLLSIGARTADPIMACVICREDQAKKFNACLREKTELKYGSQASAGHGTNWLEKHVKGLTKKGAAFPVTVLAL